MSHFDMDLKQAIAQVEQDVATAREMGYSVAEAIAITRLAKDYMVAAERDKAREQMRATSRPRRRPQS